MLLAKRNKHFYDGAYRANEKHQILEVQTKIAVVTRASDFEPLKKEALTRGPPTVALVRNQN